MSTMISPLLHEMLRKKRRKRELRRARRTTYLWAKMVREEEEDLTPLIEG